MAHKCLSVNEVYLDRVSWFLDNAESLSEVSDFLEHCPLFELTDSHIFRLIQCLHRLCTQWDLRNSIKDFLNEDTLFTFELRQRLKVFNREKILQFQKSLLSMGIPVMPLIRDTEKMIYEKLCLEGFNGQVGQVTSLFNIYAVNHKMMSPLLFNYIHTELIQNLEHNPTYLSLEQHVDLNTYHRMFMRNEPVYRKFLHLQSRYLRHHIDNRLLFQQCGTAVRLLSELIYGFGIQNEFTLTNHLIRMLHKARDIPTLHSETLLKLSIVHRYLSNRWGDETPQYPKSIRRQLKRFRQSVTTQSISQSIMDRQLAPLLKEYFETIESGVISPEGIIINFVGYYNGHPVAVLCVSSSDFIGDPKEGLLITPTHAKRQILEHRGYKILYILKSAFYNTIDPRQFLRDRLHIIGL